MDSIQQALTQLEAELHKKQQEVERLKAGISALKAITEGGPSTVSTPVSQVPSDPGQGHIAGQPDPQGPRGREAVRRVLEENEGRWVDMDQLTNTIVDRGWVDSGRPREAVRTSADRLVDDDPLVEKGRGTYRLVPDNRARLDFDDHSSEGGDELEDAES